jgi:transitional endoplasmic reticulum ATPase
MDDKFDPLGVCTQKQILAELEGAGRGEMVFTICATNRPWLIVPRVLRPGRMDRLVYIPLPDEAAREGIFKAPMHEGCVAPDVSWRVYAQNTPGFSGADIAEICNEARQLAIKMSLDKHRQYEAEKEAAMAEGRDPPEIDEAIYTITREHLDFAVRFARKSVSEADIRLFQMFAESQNLGHTIGAHGGGVDQYGLPIWSSKTMWQDQCHRAAIACEGQTRVIAAALDDESFRRRSGI